MRPSIVVARKEALEIVRTSRIIVLPAIFLFFALTGPLLAKYTPEILGAVGGDQFSSLELATPTVYDAYGQWIRNLSQIGLFVVIIVYGGIISNERQQGTAVLVLTKPVSRTGFVVAKVIVHALYLGLVLSATTALTWLVTRVVFGEAPAGALWGGVLGWFLLVLMYLALVTLFSVMLASAAGAAGLGIAVFALLAIGSIWQPFAAHTLAGLSGAAANHAAGEAAGPLGWPITTAIIVTVGAFTTAAALFSRQEL